MSFNRKQLAIQDLNIPASKNSQALVHKEHIEEIGESQKNKEVHNPVHLLTIYPELGAVVKAWPNLPEHIKAAIKALAQV